MRIKDPFIGWAMLNVLAIAVAIVRIIENRPYTISLIIASLLTLVSVYLLILRKVDGPLFINALEDERLWHISVNAQRIAFWFLFISIWCLAVALEFLNPVFLKEYFSLCLAAIGTAGLFIYMFCFVWQKYKVDDFLDESENPKAID